MSKGGWKMKWDPQILRVFRLLFFTRVWQLSSKQLLLRLQSREKMGFEKKC